MVESLALLDWIVIVAFLLVVTFVGLLFTKKGNTDLDAYFISARSLPWFVAGSSIVATNFAADTPLWVTNLIRVHGLHYIWQFWIPFVGISLGAVYFGRMWRRMRFVTDVQLLETRYSGKIAGLLRGWSGAFGALFFCPLIISWVVKAMEIISREAMGLPEEYRIYTTIGVMLIALIMCASSGLFGVVYTDFIQFIFATGGTILLAVFAIQEVGGLASMREQLTNLSAWEGNGLSMLPRIGSGIGAMSPWNAIGMFGLLWIANAISGGYSAQRLLACKSTQDASIALVFSTTVYHALLAWPWILVGLCSMILIPEINASDQAAAYPQMLVRLLPIGLRGLLIAAMLAAFVSTMSTLFNWGSSYLVNDLFRPFIFPKSSEKTYLIMARLATLFIAVTGACISFLAKDIQTLLTISYVVSSGTMVIALLRWCWWRLNAMGDFISLITGWVLAVLLLFVKLFDGPARWVLNLNNDQDFSTDPDLVGARMLFMVVVVTASAVIGSLLTKPESPERLKAFLLQAKPFRWGWLPVVRSLDTPYQEYEGLGRTLVSWLICVIAVGSLLFSVGEILLGSMSLGLLFLFISVVTLTITIKRINQDGAREIQMNQESESSSKHSTN